MAKYDPLRTFLAADPAIQLTLSFAQVEQIIGTTLPASVEGTITGQAIDPSAAS